VICDDCGGELVHEIWELDVALGPRVVSIDQPGWCCLSCGATRFSASDLDVADRHLAALQRLARLQIAPPAAKAA
jgi:hypothetical protein